MSLKKLNKKSKEFSLSQESIDDREDRRLSFISKFPLEKIKDLSVDEYVQGTDKNSFCYWLEFKKILFGIGGANASKYGIYKAKNGNYFTGAGKKKKQFSGSELYDFFTNIKAGILQALKYTENNEIEKIKTIETPLWNMVLQKILCIYFPEKFITIGASDVLIECAQDINLEGIELKPKNSIQVNYECKKLLSSLPEYKEWSYEKMGSFIWETYLDDSKRDYFILGSKYGDNNNEDVFPQMFDKKVISIGFASNRDLEEYYLKNHSGITDYLKEKGEAPKSYNALKYFLNLKVGDRIAIKADGSPKGKKGFLSIVGIAEVVEKDGNVYRYEPNGLGHLINVKFIKAPVYKEFELGGYGRTIHKLSKQNHIDLIFKSDYAQNKFPEALKEDNHNYEKNEIQMNFPLNTILYGPPGTGKTYNTILRAAEIIENRKIDSYKEALDIFKANLHNQIEFITFHQNYSYEDFIQGIRPDTENDSQLTFERKDGVFKIISDKALKNLEDSKKPQVPKKSFEDSFKQFISPLIEGEVEEIEVKMKKVSFFISAVSNKSIDFRKANGETAHTLSLNTLKKMYTAESVLEIQGLAPYYSPLLNELLEIGKDSTGKKEKIISKNYVIIIDEINRANISRVFGELITLIEPDKRSHGTIPLEARLPSGDSFIVPSNLYIIGTMNTADKSIALLDIALRRRFEFESMYPLYEINGDKIYDVEILEKINKQIIKSKGHDFQIGHAYFMGDNNDLFERMNKKVIPLLLEYYMNDEKEVKGILQSSGLKIEEGSWPLKVSGRND